MLKTELESPLLSSSNTSTVLQQTIRYKALPLPFKRSTMAKQTTTRQLELMLNFLEEHKALAFVRTRSKEGSALATRLWSRCAEILNSDVDGVQKSPKDWKRYYNLYKSRVKAKKNAIKSGLIKPGAGTSEYILTPLEKRLIGILGGSCSPTPDPPVNHYPPDRLISEPTLQEVKVEPIDESHEIKEEAANNVPDKAAAEEHNETFNSLISGNEIQETQIEISFDRHSPTEADTQITQLQSSQMEGGTSNHRYSPLTQVKEDEGTSNYSFREKQAKALKRRKLASPPPKISTEEKTLQDIEMARIAADKQLAQSRIQADREIAQAQVEALHTLSSSIKEMTSAFTLGFQMIANVLTKRKRRHNSDSSSGNDSHI